MTSPSVVRMLLAATGSLCVCTHWPYIFMTRWHVFIIAHQRSNARYRYAVSATGRHHKVRHRKQEAQLMLTNPRDAFRCQSTSPNIVPFHMLGIASSCAIVTLSLIRLRKCRDLEIRARGHSRSLKVVPFDRLHNDFLQVFYRNFVPKTYSTSKMPWPWGPSRSVEISPFDTAHTTSYWRSMVTMDLVSFLRYSMSKMSWPWNRVRGHSRSLKMGHSIDCVWFPISVL